MHPRVGRRGAGQRLRQPPAGAKRRMGSVANSRHYRRHGMGPVCDRLAPTSPRSNRALAWGRGRFGRVPSARGPVAGSLHQLHGKGYTGRLELCIDRALLLALRKAPPFGGRRVCEENERDVFKLHIQRRARQFSSYRTLEVDSKHGRPSNLISPEASGLGQMAARWRPDGARRPHWLVILVLIYR